jgi:hypothetical protein
LADFFCGSPEERKGLWNVRQKQNGGDVMTINNIKVIRVLVLAAGFLEVLPSIVEARSVKLTCSSQRTIRTAVERLNPGDTLLVDGACFENVVIPERIVDVIIDGSERVVSTTRISSASFWRT